MLLEKESEFIEEPKVEKKRKPNPYKKPSTDEKIKRNINLNKHTYIIITTFFTLFFLFTVLPVITSIIISFTYFNMLEFPHFVGWDNYARLFLEDDIFLISLKNTILFAAVTGPVSYVACFVFAWLINEDRKSTRLNSSHVAISY